MGNEPRQLPFRRRRRFNSAVGFCVGRDGDATYAALSRAADPIVEVHQLPGGAVRAAARRAAVKPPARR
nr:hypothetical protein [Rhizobium leguminosarum]